MCLALRASGLWLRYATLQNWIPSFGLRPHALHPGAIQGKEGIQFCHLATMPTPAYLHPRRRRGGFCKGRALKAAKMPHPSPTPLSKGIFARSSLGLENCCERLRDHRTNSRSIDPCHKSGVPYCRMRKVVPDAPDFSQSNGRVSSPVRRTALGAQIHLK